MVERGLERGLKRGSGSPAPLRQYRLSGRHRPAGAEGAPNSPRFRAHEGQQGI